MQLKVLHLISSLSCGGRERQLCYIYKYNNPTRQDIKIIYLNESQVSLLDVFKIRNKDFIRIKSKNFFCRIYYVYDILHKYKPDAVFSWGLIETIILLILQPFMGYKFINFSIQHGIVKLKFSHYLRMLLLHCSKNIVANSLAGLKANHLRRGHVLYNGVDDKFFNAKTSKKEVVKLETYVNAMVLISVANFVPYKDYFTVLEALVMLKAEGYDYSYIIIGDGPLKRKVALRIKKYRLENTVKLLGQKNNVEEYLACADIFIHSSRGEGVSNAILEAMASGLPIIASNTGGTPEIVSEVNGLLFEFKNSKQLASHIKVLYNDKYKKKCMGNNAFRITKELFSMSVMMNNYYRIVKEIVCKNNE
jgi:glycosyltransferase involved in cell wall biosynthesis